MEWPSVRLVDIALIAMGQSPPGETYNDNGEGLPFFQGKADFGDQYPTPRKWCSAPTRVAEPGDILLSVRAPVGPTNVAREKSCIGRGLAAIRANPACAEQAYLRFFFKHVEPTLSLQGQGSTFAAIKSNEVAGLKVPLSPLSEQRRIVEILDQADHLRRLRAEADAKAARILPALFIKMFGDPATNPMGWPVAQLGDVAQEFISGGTPSTKVEHYWTGDIPWITGADINDNIVVAGRKWITQEAIENSATHVVPKGAILLVTRTGVGKVAKAGADIAISQDLTGIVLKERINADFVVAAIQQKTNSLLGIQQGAIIKGVLRKDVEKLEIPLPSLSIQQKFANSLADIMKLEVNRSESHRHLETLFQTTLHRAFTGDLTASWREVHKKEKLQEMGQQATTLEEKNYRGIRQ